MANSEEIKSSMVVIDGQTYEIKEDGKIFKKLESGDVEVTSDERKKHIIAISYREHVLKKAPVSIAKK